MLRENGTRTFVHALAQIRQATLSLRQFALAILHMLHSFKYIYNFSSESLAVAAAAGGSCASDAAVGAQAMGALALYTCTRTDLGRHAPDLKTSPACASFEQHQKQKFSLEDPAVAAAAGGSWAASEAALEAEEEWGRVTCSCIGIDSSSHTLHFIGHLAAEIVHLQGSDSTKSPQLCSQPTNAHLRARPWLQLQAAPVHPGKLQALRPGVLWRLRARWPAELQPRPGCRSPPQPAPPLLCLQMGQGGQWFQKELRMKWCFVPS